MGGCCASSDNTASERTEELGGIKAAEKAPVQMGAKDTTDAAATVVKNNKKKYAKNAPIKLGYWKIRGLAQPIRYLLEYIEHPWVDEHYEQGDAPLFSTD